MKRLLPTLLAMLLPVLLASCALGPPAAPALFDLGPLPSARDTALPALPPVSIAEIGVPIWLDRSLMYYRLGYANAQQPRPYAHNRWTMPPSQLIAQRLKARIAQAGGIALPAADGAAGVPLLEIEVDDFTQNFSAPSRSEGRVSLRASVFKGRRLLAQKSFESRAPAPSPDAAGGAHALALASDAAIADTIVWLATLPLK